MRAVELSLLRLDDLDWRAEQIIVDGKAHQLRRARVLAVTRAEEPVDPRSRRELRDRRFVPARDPIYRLRPLLRHFAATQEARAARTVRGSDEPGDGPGPILMQEAERSYLLAGRVRGLLPDEILISAQGADALAVSRRR